ncbi:probable LRR receptor-like serine/threonine-protein kinase At3g47570 [Oryza glaberrima]|uniref:probable LRR receptor-like serine/threonine-protein kinase At3g47570 n=1 Tax=Oryza glaberrima TaxID=4538 RepID=UPI00224C447A|nr:probable LRR receptor-like serine/threonine-protein kinase At3g47570 [Oryza glaberrima]
MKIIIIGLCLLVIMASSVVQIMCNSLYGNGTDRLSLLEFRKAISLDAQQALMSWNDSNYFCSWEGVLCRVKTPHRVISLNLTNRGLEGQISPALGNMTFLKFLSLSSNSFRGEIPLSLGHLHHLESLYLSNNTLQGDIPDFTNCSNLKSLWLSRNHLVGQFNSNFPPRLQDLILTSNNITGTIPSSLANITSLQRLSIADNSIKGNIPHEFAGFPMLQILYADGNKLAGGFPRAILNISTIVRLGFSSNYLSGEIPSNLFDFLPQIQLFVLDSNLFRGHIPNSLGNASKLQHVDISSNNFTGVIPGTIGKLTELYRLNLEKNQLHARNKQDWEFMSSLANCTGLTLLSISDNCLEGHVPSSLGNLSVQLQLLLLGGNQLSGGFPPGFQYLHNLISISIDSNNFSGVLPEWLGSLQNLQLIGLYNNNFTGIIPSSLSNLSQLVYLYLHSNQFYGHLPPSLGNHKLQQLTIGYNNIQGVIPKEIFKIPSLILIDLSFNNLDGSIPIEVGDAKQLTYLRLSSNKLSGDIPNTLGNCESLEKITLDQNIFSGSIPTTLGNILNLKVLNLSQNNLSGSIPPSLGNLKLLEELDLSFNHLKGEVPVKGIFKNASAIQIDGNEALCGGVPELHLHACSIIPFDSTKHKQSIVLKIVIPLASVLSLAMIISILLLLNRKQKRKSIDLPSFGRKFVRVSYHDLAKATEGFSTSHLIGRGRYSSVYQGKFTDEKVVAVKVFNLETMGAQKSFITECNALRKLRHRNIVPILTACASTSSNGNDFKALLYEFMPQGDLNKLLHSTGAEEFNGENHGNRITLAQRLSIIVDVADAIEYLHHNNQETIVHCDLKPSNILLDDDMIAHVGDFGLARFKIDFMGSNDSNSIYSTAIKGTIGYVAPEYAAGAEVSTYGDVFSFGVVLLEIFLRKKPTDDMFKDGLDIVKFVEVNFPDRLPQIVDPELLQETHVGIKERVLGCLNSVLNIGLCCTKTSPYERMDMREVAARLSKIKEVFLSGN